jgi:ComF family protein
LLAPNQKFHRILSDFAALIYPNYCLTCDRTLVKGESFICLRCLHDMPLTYLWKDQPNVLHQRFFEIPNLKHAYALFWFQKSGKVQQLLHNIKYKGEEELGIWAGQLLGEHLRLASLNTAYEAVLAVPLHPKKERKRGYNQSALIAKGIAERLEIPFLNILQKTANITSQTHKHRLERFENVENTFSINQKECHAVKNRNVLIVDDVLTTGATLQSACNPVLDIAKTISVATLAVVK